MDIEHFLKERTKFSKYFYVNAAKPFTNIMQDIEDEKPPYIPPYSEDGEPPFLIEWLEAKDGLNSVGLTTISMLSSAIQLYLSCWADRIETTEKPLKRKSNKGWLNAYKKITEDFGVNYSNCPADFNLIEQIVLARNRTQHLDQITSQRVSHLEKDLSKYPSPHFVSEEDMHKYSSNKSWWMLPDVHTTETKINKAIIEIEAYVSWLESEYNRVLSEQHA